MDGLTAKNIEILRFYAETGNRELYWNHLASIPGADGYGLLALGVVRNDNLPGQVANAYAQSGAATQNDAGSPYSNKAPTEREWDAFGKTLLGRDLERRVRWMDAGKPELDFATYDRIHQWVQETGHWDATASHNVASALYRAQAEDPLVRRVDRVSGYLGAGGEEYVVATYAPHGDKAPFFQARIDGRDAAKHPAHENLLGAEQARQASVQQPLRVPDHEQTMTQPGPVVGT